MYVVSHNSTCSLITFEKYESSLDVQSKHFMSLGICCKSIKPLSNSMKEKHISTKYNLLQEQPYRLHSFLSE